MGYLFQNSPLQCALQLHLWQCFSASDNFKTRSIPMCFFFEISCEPTTLKTEPANKNSAIRPAAVWSAALKCSLSKKDVLCNMIYAVSSDLEVSVQFDLSQRFCRHVSSLLNFFFFPPWIDSLYNSLSSALKLTSKNFFLVHKWGSSNFCPCQTLTKINVQLSFTLL